MAGLGYKSFSAGDVLTAAQVQGYLQDQAVMRFADSTARASAIGTANFTEGMVSYLDDTDQIEYYSGSSWASIAPVSTQGLTLLNTTSFSAVASQSINDVFSATYENYLIQIKSANATNSSLRMRLRVSGADDTNNVYSTAYSVQRFDSAAVSDVQDGPTTSFAIVQSTNNQINFSNINIFRPNLVTSTHLNLATSNTQVSGSFSFMGGAVFTNTTAFTGFTIFPATSTISGVISVYGYNA